MKVFVTGATGFIGSAVVAELLAGGYQVIGLVRSKEGAEKLQKLGVEPHLGDVQDLESLRSGAAKADAVIHTAFIHDFSKWKENCEIDRKAVETIGTVLEGSSRPFLISSGTALAVSPTGGAATEDDPIVDSSVVPRAATEEAGRALLAKGVNVITIRLPQVHNPEKHGLITYVIELARQKGYAAYVGDGANGWSAGHVSDVAKLFKLALEANRKGAIYNAVGESSVSIRSVTEVIAEGLHIPVKSITAEEAGAYYTWMSHFISSNLASSSEKTKKELNWNPSGPTLLTSLAQHKY